MNFREKLEMAPQIGTFVKIASTDIIEIIAMSGFDFVVIDMEHSPLSLTDVKNLCLTAQSAGLKVLVRPYENSRSLILRILDLGVDGIQVPMIHDKEAATYIVNRCMYPPEGERGFALSHRAGKFGFVQTAEYIRKCNDDIFISVQIESKTAMENIYDISKISRLDMLFMGPADLSTSLGVSNDFISGGLAESFKNIIDAARTNNKLVGTHVNNTEKLKYCLNKGLNFILWDYDLGMFKKQTESDIKTIKSLIK